MTDESDEPDDPGFVVVEVDVSSLDCPDEACDRARDHEGPHRSRWWDARAGVEVVEEWETDAQGNRVDLA